MKKSLFLSWVLISASALMANPIALPQAFISEFRFQSNNEWELEITFALYGGVYVRSDFDSICVGSSSGISRIRLDNVKDSTVLFVVTADSLATSLSINPHGDCVRIYSYPSKYLSGRSIVDSMSFGDYPGATLDTIPPGYSICRMDYGVFCLDKDPTIGAANDTSGTCGTLVGSVYNGDGSRIISGNYQLDYRDYHPIVLNGDGTYSARVFARRVTLNEIIKIAGGGETFVPIDSMTYDVYPDSVVKQDIHFQEIVGVKERPTAQPSKVYIVNYPNPFNPSTNFYVEVPAGLSRDKGRIDIYNSIGQKVFVIPMSGGSLYSWNGTDMSGQKVSSGVYHYRLVLGDKIYETGSMVLLK